MPQKPNPRFWSGTRTLVTGGNGFLGAHVTRALYRLGADVVAAPRTEVDLRDPDAVRRQWLDVRPQVVLHLAARVGGIGANRENPATYFRDNLLMGTNVIHESHRAGVERVVTVGTVCAYPKYTVVPFRESDLWNGFPEETNAPYGIAKRALLMQSMAYRAQYGLNATYVLPANLYGEGDHFEPSVSHVIPALLRKIVEAQDRGEDRIVCWGDGTPTREFLHAGDAARGILLTAEHYDSPQPLNLGTGVETSISELLGLLTQLCGFQGEVVFDPSYPNGQPRRCLDVSRAKDEIGFVADTPLRTGLARTVAWYLRERNCSDAA